MRDSSDDEEEREVEGARARMKAARERAASGKKAFNTADVLVAVLGSSGADGAKFSKGVMGHMPSHFPQEVVENWKQWATKTPNSLGEIPMEKRLRVCEMPMKCSAAPTAPVTQEHRMQTELITYDNPGGRSFNKEQRQRDQTARSALEEGDVTLGATVALKRDGDATVSTSEIGGFGTPFYVGDVREVKLHPAGSSSGKACVSKVTIHYRMPIYRDKFVNIITKPWALACHGQHKWTTGCERRIACKKAAQEAGSDTAAWLHEADAEEIMETALELTTAAVLTKKSKERLAEHGDWHSELGIEKRAEMPARKKRQRQKR